MHLFIILFFSIFITFRVLSFLRFSLFPLSPASFLFIISSSISFRLFYIFLFLLSILCILSFRNFLVQHNSCVFFIISPVFFFYLFFRSSYTLLPCIFFFVLYCTFLFLFFITPFFSLVWFLFLPLSVCKLSLHICFLSSLHQYPSLLSKSFYHFLRFFFLFTAIGFLARSYTVVYSLLLVLPAIYHPSSPFPLLCSPFPGLLFLHRQSNAFPSHPNCRAFFISPYSVPQAIIYHSLPSSPLQVTFVIPSSWTSH